MQHATPDLPPAPTDPSEARRVDHLRLRRRMLYGQWQEDARRHLRRALGMLRSEVIGDPDLSANPFRAICSSVAALYDRAPIVRHPDGLVVEEAMTALVRRAGLWPMMQRVQRDTIGLREMLIRVDAERDEASGAVLVTYRPVFPDLVEVVPHAEDPERPVKVSELRRYRPKGMAEQWVREVWDISGDVPVHRIESAEGVNGVAPGQDISALCGLPEGGASGDAYPARRSDRRPILPYVVHHASRTGCMWDSWEGVEVVEGTLQVSTKWTLYGHFLRHASWSQRYVVGAQPAGVDVEGDPGLERQTTPSDATFVAQLESTNDGQQPVIGQWSVTVDPVAFAESIGIYERRLAAFAGLDPSDVQRVSGDPRSGYALAISREGKRESQRRFGPVFQPADQEVLAITAALVNRELGAPTLPEDGWEVTYQALPPSPDEARAEQDRVFGLLQRGLIGKVDAYLMLHPHASRAEAEASVGAAAPPPAPPMVARPAPTADDTPDEGDTEEDDPNG